MEAIIAKLNSKYFLVKGGPYLGKLAGSLKQQSYKDAGLNNAYKYMKVAFP